MQLPHSWRTAWLFVWPRYRLPLYILGSVLLVVVAWSVPSGRSWLVEQAEAFGIMHPPNETQPSSSPIPSPTADPLSLLQKGLDSLTVSAATETAARKQGQTQLQDTLAQLQVLLTDLDRSSAELSRLVGTPVTSVTPRAVPTIAVPASPSTRTQTSAGAVLEQRTALPHQVVTSGKLSAGATVSLNSGTIAELESLPGIGPAYAQRIIAFRISHGGFKTVDELSSVKGIGSSRLGKLRSRVVL